MIEPITLIEEGKKWVKENVISEFECKELEELPEFSERELKFDIQPMIKAYFKMFISIGKQYQERKNKEKLRKCIEYIRLMMSLHLLPKIDYDEEFQEIFNGINEMINGYKELERE